MILGGYLIVCGVGVSAIALAKSEQKRMKKGDRVNAQRISIFGNFTLPTITIGGIMYVFYEVQDIWF